MPTTADLAARARAAFARRDHAVTAAAEQAEVIAAACHRMAQRFAAGGKILAFGNGGPTTDAQHVSVEFVHPVIVGKRALPAVSLNADGASVVGAAHHHGSDHAYAHLLGVLGRRDDIALGLSSDGQCRDVLRGLEAAHDAGLLTVALVGDAASPIATSPAVDHVVAVDSDDPGIVKEVHVTAYHVLWELVHVFLEQPGLLDDPPDAPPGDSGTPAVGVEALYPFLYDGRTDLDAVLVDVAASTRTKFAEVADLRQRVGQDQADALARCALALADAFATGGKLLAFGNGGSSSDAQQVAQVHLDPPDGQRALPALCLTNDVAVVTALSNDVDFDVVFARQVRAFGQPGDIALGLSTSGNSGNVIQAFAAARDRGMVTAGLAGNTGGEMAQVDTIDHLFVVPSSSVHRIQEVQTTLYHVLHELVVTVLADVSALPEPVPLRPPPGPG
jgi:D-sedoheptulose 7-phosphate isomerase